MKRLTIRISEFCKISGLSRTTAYALIADRTLRTVKVGRSTLIKMDSVVALLDLAEAEVES